MLYFYFIAGVAAMYFKRRRVGRKNVADTRNHQVAINLEQNEKERKGEERRGES